MLEEMTMLTVILMAMVQVVGDGDDNANCRGVDGIVSGYDDADGGSDLGREDGKGEHHDDPHSSQRLRFPSSFILLTFIQDPGSDSWRHIPAGELE